MGRDDFNKNMDKYLSSRRSYKTKKINFSEIFTKLKPNKTFKIRPKIKETKIKFVDPDEIVHEAEQKKIRKRNFFSRIFKRKCKKNVVDEELNPVSENFEFEVKEDNDEFDHDLAEIEELERNDKKNRNMLKFLLMKLKIIKDVEDKEEEVLQDELNMVEEENDDIKDELRTVINFSVDVLKLLPTKDFEWLKEKDSFKSYKRIVRKYMKRKEE